MYIVYNVSIPISVCMYLSEYFKITKMLDQSLWFNLILE